MKNKESSGYSLLELLIAMSLGIFVIGTTLHFFETSRKAQSVQNELSDLRENVKFALDAIKEDIQLAGFYGCATRWSDSSLINTLNTPQDDFKWNFSQAIYGTEYNFDVNASPAKTWSPALDPTIENAFIYQGDTLTIRHAARREFNIVTHANSSSDIKITANNKIKKYDYLLATDCEHSSIFQKTNSDNTQTLSHATGSLPSQYAGNASSDLGKQFSDEAKVMKMLSVTYFVAKRGGSIPALFRKEGARNAEEILPSIIDMQIQYGVDTDNNQAIDAYYTADDVQSNNWWEDVLIVRITIKAKAYKDNILTGDETSHYSNGSEMEYEMTAAVNLRNRLP